jgi:crotonobetainyl-CoA:carnitine CoA-transferase CaiB-like acyl-CoA transferase
MLARAGIELASDAAVEITGGDPILASKFPVGEAAAAALAACGVAASDLWAQRGGERQRASVDVRAAAASLLGFTYQQIDGAATPRTNEGNPAVALYECADGRWIHLHGGFPHLRAGTLDVLGCGFDAGEIAAACRRRNAQELEDALAAAGMCGAMVRTGDEWRAHAQGQALATLPAVEVLRIGDAPPEAMRRGDRPLSGVRALDLTRVLAGPACGRALAEHGADVLLVSSPRLPSITPFVVDTSHGKRSAFLDLDQDAGAATLRELVRGADVFSQGYRSGAMERRGFGPEDVARLRPGIIYVSINCYGHVGPWRNRPGWEQLAQTVTGIASAEGSLGAPRLIPAAACDYTTGYLAAYGVMVALGRRAIEGGSWHVRASLCQTAMWFERLGATCDPAAASGIGDAGDLVTQTETPFGRLTHLVSALRMSVTPPLWTLPTVPLGAHAPEWLPR